MTCITTPQYSLVINGELYGYFPAQKGIRQGDPMSPYLFTLVMEYFSRCMRNMATTKSFKFHPKCHRLKLTHLCYADDLFIFSKADRFSISLIQNTLAHFASVSGLFSNQTKSNIYFGGTNNSLRNEIAAILGFQEDTLPVKYLGVPLSSKSLSIHDYQPLIDKITDTIRHWTARYLSYAGRLVLVKSILQSLHGYWCRVFLLPKLVLK
eukprot:TRINITY_DN1616_c0_g2_i2.p1 TRINITY_DN1616_c0_g2~~TRINITY_DN1616_c0_g2_i2.p1  ORF type:complete len:209 (-),score=18.87 TRINITY_DN1616_c0_g2_i2:2068-2694(-)